MEQLAEIIGVSWQTIQQWENGKTAPKRQRAEKVAAALEISVGELLFGENDAEPIPTGQPRGIVLFPDRHAPVIEEVIDLMLQMSDQGRERLAERARQLADQFPSKQNKTTLFQ